MLGWRRLALNPAMFCLSLESPPGHPREQVSREIPVFLGRSAAVNPGGQLHGEGIVPAFPSIATSVVVLEPITLTGSFSSLEQVLETLGGGTVLV